MDERAIIGKKMNSLNTPFLEQIQKSEYALRGKDTTSLWRLRWNSNSSLIFWHTQEEMRDAKESCCS